MGAAEALGEIKKERAVKPLINALNDKDYVLSKPDEDFVVRWSASMALGNIRSEKAVEPLISLLKDENFNVQWCAVSALGEMRSEKAAEPLITALRDKNSIMKVNIIVAIIDALGKIKSKKAVEPLIDSLKDKNTTVKKAASDALGSIRSEKAVEPLVNMLNDQDTELREKVVNALWEINSKKAIEPLVNKLKDENSNIRQIAVKALGIGRNEKAIELLINTLEDKDEEVRKVAADTLGKVSTPENKNRLRNLLNSDNEFLVNTAYEILHEIERKQKSEPILFEDLKKRSKITPKFGIFVSSVQKELENERVIIQDLVENDPFLSADYTSLLYEYEPASPEKTLDGCLNALNGCQVYLLIVGMKYGTLVGEISITHREYRYAKEKGFPILVFIKGERNIEREQGTEALLREIESDDFKYKRFRNVIELKNEVNESLKKLLRDEDKFLKI
ncbi:MAG: HEAT repeat domain-containing protein [Methanosarcina sp.]|nr:HEAT repeat domain-containing protein [Methanosarcina sp.]